jgi:hypothetical protein
MTIQRNERLSPLKNIRCYRYCIWEQVQLKLSLRALWRCLGEGCEGNVPLILNPGRLFHASAALSPGMIFRYSLCRRLGRVHIRSGRSPLPAIKPLFLGFPVRNTFTLLTELSRLNVYRHFYTVTLFLFVPYTWALRVCVFVCDECVCVCVCVWVWRCSTICVIFRKLCFSGATAKHGRSPPHCWGFSITHQTNVTLT